MNKLTFKEFYYQVLTNKDIKYKIGKITDNHLVINDITWNVDNEAFDFLRAHLDNEFTYEELLKVCDIWTDEFIKNDLLTILSDFDNETPILIHNHQLNVLSLDIMAKENGLRVTIPYELGKHLQHCKTVGDLIKKITN